VSGRVDEANGQFAAPEHGCSARKNDGDEGMKLFAWLTNSGEEKTFRDSKGLRPNGLDATVDERTEQLLSADDLLRSEIEERKPAGMALRQSEERLRNIFETAPVGIVLADRDFRFVKVNSMLCRMTGYTEQELLTFTYMDLFPPEDLVSELRDLHRLLQGGIQDYTLDKRFFKKNGEILWFALTASVIRDETGNPHYLLGMLLDISERKQREREREILLSMTTVLWKAATSSELMRISLEHLAELLNLQGAAIATRHSESGEMIVEHAVGRWVDRKGMSFSMDEMVSGQLSANGQAFLFSDPQNNSPFAESCLSDEITTIACVPLVAQQTIGALVAGYETPLTGHETRILEEVGAIIANAIHRAVLHEQTIRQIQRLSALSAIDAAINASLDLRVTFKIILDEVIHLLRVDAAAVLLLNRRSQTLKYAAVEGFRSIFPQDVQFRVGVGHAGRAVLERSIVSVPDLSQDAEGFMIPSLLAEEGFVSYLAVPLIVKGEVKGILEVFHRTLLINEREWLDFLSTLAGQTAIAIGDAELFNELQRSNTELILAYDATIEGWSKALDMRDKQTEGHSRRVTGITLKLANAMELNEDELLHMRRGALLHDIGKMGIPDTILLKPGPLTEEEREIMQKHPVYAREMLSPVVFLRPALDIPCFHHEKWDGTGYPEGLRGEQIPLAARIFAVVDVWDALISDRPYRPGWPEDKVKEYLREQSGKDFDPMVVEMFLSAGFSESAEESSP
jgi:PAS domain S-box-containing protein